MRAVVLDVAGGTRGWWHSAPPGAAASGLGIVMVPPLGWEDEASYRPRRVWADELAADGHAVLRIDLPGTGDSAGGPRDPDRVAAWLDAIGAATDVLRAARVARVAGIGLAASGLLLLEAAARGASLDDLVLWAPPAGGRAAVRELRAFSRLESADVGEDPQTLPAGEIRTGGFVLTAETTAALTALQPAAAAGLRAGSRVLLLGRDGRQPPRAVLEGLAAGQARIETGPGNGWSGFVAPPQTAELDVDTTRRVATFLREVSTPSGPAPTPPAPTPLLGPGFRETVLTVSGSPAVGVLAEPQDGPLRPLTVVLLNAGAIRHIGPNRLWVEAARRWAAQGVPVLRLDLVSIGDADGEPRPYGEDLSLYEPHLTDHVVEVLDALQERGLPPRFLVAGLCSGAYWSLHTALRDERVRSVLLLNPRLLFWDEDAGSKAELLRAAAVLRRGGLHRLREASDVRGRLIELVRSAPRVLRRRLRRDRSSPDPLSAALARLRDRDQRMALAFSEGLEPVREQLDRSRRWPELARSGVVVRRLPLTSHTLKGLAAQAGTHDLLDTRIADALEAD